MLLLVGELYAGGLTQYASLGKQVATWGINPVRLQGREHIDLELVMCTRFYLPGKMQRP